MTSMTRRTFIRGIGGLAGVIAVGGLAACDNSGAGRTAVGPRSAAVAAAERARRVAGRSTVTARLTPRPVTLDLGGRTVESWAYGDQVPGPMLRATAGDLLRVTVDNQLPADTSVHWHGLALRNDMDGVPHITQDPIATAGSFAYEFVAPHPGTYFYHPHTGLQLDRGLYGVLVIDDPAEPGAYDDEWVVVLDDWIDGTGRTPDDVFAELTKNGGGMGHGSMGEGMGTGMGMGGGDVDYPLYLVNGRTQDAPHQFAGRAGQRVRVRFVNAGTDTAFRVAVGGHRMTVTHSDGYPVIPVSTDALLIGMGERVDVTLPLGDGVFPLVASAEGKEGQGRALIRTGGGGVPSADATISELSRQVLLGTDLTATQTALLPDGDVDRRHDVTLGGSMSRYRWTLNGRAFPDSAPLPVRSGERVRLRFINETMMFHPMHLHGHTFGLVDGGARKDTVVVRPMTSLEVDLDADNPGQWALHCHNILHAEAGMMTTLSYRT